MVARFLAWWIGELSTLIPARLRGHDDRRPLLLAAYVDGAIVLEHRKGDRRSLLGPLESLPKRTRSKLKRARQRGTISVVLLALPDQIGRRPLTIPKTSERDLRGVLGFELDRLTPYEARELYFGFRVAGQQVDQTGIELVFVPRELMAPALDQLAHAGLSPHRIETIDQRGNLEGISLSPEKMPASEARSRPFSKALFAIAVLLAGALMVLELHNRTRYRDALRTAVSEVRAIAHADFDRHEQDDAQLAKREAYERKADHPSALIVLTALTEALPDHTWLERVDMDGQKVTLAGVSGDAASLGSTLEATALFSEPQFVSPISRDVDGRERFVISAQIVRPRDR